MPNHCGVYRTKMREGYVMKAILSRVAFCGLHRGEEPPVTGRNGSGVIFSQVVLFIVIIVKIIKLVVE